MKNKVKLSWLFLLLVGTITPVVHAQLALEVEIRCGSLYFPAETATIYVLIKVNGVPTDVADVTTDISGYVHPPTGLDKDLTFSSVSTGIYKATYSPIPTTVGTYLIVVTATISPDTVTEIESFQVSKTLSDNIPGLKTTVLDSIDTIQLGIDSINIAVSTLQTDVSGIKTTLANMNATLNSVKTKIDTVQTGITSLNTIVNNVNASLSDLILLSENHVKENQTINIRQINASVVKLIDYCKELNNTIRQVNATVENLSLEVRDNMSALVTRMDWLSGNLTATITTINGFSGTLNSISTTLGNIQSTVTTMRSELSTTDSTIKSAITDARADVKAKIDTLVTEIQTSLTAMNTTAQSITTTVGSLRSDLDNMKDGINDLQTTQTIYPPFLYGIAILSLAAVIVTIAVWMRVGKLTTESK